VKWRIEKTSPVAATIRIKYKPNREWEQWFLFGSDAHLDNPHCLQDLKRYHLKQAVERGAGIFELGDTLDAMQGKNDRRGSKADVIPELQVDNYWDALVDYGAEFFMPYKENLAFFGYGNHETSARKHSETDPLNSMVRDLRKGGSPAILGGYRGWFRFMFEREDGHGGRQSKRGYFNHGSGGGGPVTKGVIKTNRRTVYLPEADFVFSAHIHEQWVMKQQRVRLLDSGKEISETQYHVQLPTYKEEFVNVKDGFHVEREAPPKPLGAWWLRFYVSPLTDRIEGQLIMAEV
jgi:hypothetical protein